MSAITETEHQGVQTVLAGRTGATISAGLMFRVGRADETLATTGITHLVEHLSLHEHGLGDLHYNGSTDNCFTHFHVAGTEADVVAYLNGVCAELNDLPLERLETEKEILHTEAEGRGGGPAPAMALYRYGAQGFGLASYDEMGLPNATPDALRQWVGKWFTRENAVLWITSDRIPEGLDLTLAPGTHQPMPQVTSALPGTPAWLAGSNNLTCLSSVIPRSTAGSIFAGVLGKRLFRELRQKGGLCYTASSEYYPRDRDSALLWAVADAHPDKVEAVVGGFIDVLAGMRFGTIEQSDLDAVRTTTLRQFDEPDLAAHRLPGYAANLLSGQRNLTDAELIEEITETTVDDLQQIANQVWDSALFQVPALGLDWAGVHEAPQYSSSAVHGRRFESLERDATAVIVGNEGVSLARGEGHATVLYRDSVAMLVWPDGARRVFGRDGFHVHIEPSIHPLDQAALAVLDAGVPGNVRVNMPMRDPSRIPQPRPSEGAPKKEKMRAQPATGPWNAAVRLIWKVLMWVLAALAALFLIVALDPSTREESGVGSAVTTAVMALGFAFGAWRSYLRSRRA